MTPEVAAAIDEIKVAFPNATMTAREDGEGVAVLVEPVSLGAPYSQRDTWIGFRITFQYPYADVYPHFVRGDLSRLDSTALGEGMSQSTFEGRKAVQISRRSNKLDPNHDTALIKLHKVLTWLRNR